MSGLNEKEEKLLARFERVGYGKTGLIVIVSLLIFSTSLFFYFSYDLKNSNPLESRDFLWLSIGGVFYISVFLIIVYQRNKLLTIIRK